MARLHVLLKKEELDSQRLAGKVVVVVDVLFATSTIAAALAGGAAEVVPALDGASALAEARRRPAGSYLLSGELDAETLPGFAHPTPLALGGHDLRGKAVIYSTTNGTVAVKKAGAAARVYAGSLLNGEAMADHLARRHPGDAVLLVCSGSADAFNLEDFYGAGHLVSLLARGRGDFDPSDAALAARLLHDRSDALDCLRSGRIGRMMLERGLAHEVAYAARKGELAVVPELRDGSLRPA